MTGDRQPREKSSARETIEAVLGGGLYLLGCALFLLAQPLAFWLFFRYTDVPAPTSLGGWVFVLVAAGVLLIIAEMVIGIVVMAIVYPLALLVLLLRDAKCNRLCAIILVAIGISALVIGYMYWGKKQQIRAALAADPVVGTWELCQSNGEEAAPDRMIIIFQDNGTFRWCIEDVVQGLGEICFGKWARRADGCITVTVTWPVSAQQGYHEEGPYLVADFLDEPIFKKRSLGHRHPARDH